MIRGVAKMTGLMFNKFYDAMSDVLQSDDHPLRLDEHITWHHHHAQNAAKFIFVNVPVNAVYDFGVELLKNNLLRLPFPSCYFQVAVKFMDGDVQIGYFATDDMVGDHSSISILPMSVDGIGTPTLLKDGVLRYATAAGPATPYVAAVVIALLAFLNTKGTQLERVVPKESVNTKRKQQGKRPLPEYAVVRIDPEIVKRYASSQGGTHSSPRPHLRRGHVRRLDEERKTIVRPSFVNANGSLIPPPRYRVETA